MATATEPVCVQDNSLAADTRGVDAVVRQPILDQRGRVHGFRLHFRQSPASRAAAFFGLEKPSAIKRLTGGMRAFVHCPAEMLDEDLAQRLAPSLTVLVLSAGFEPDPERIEILQRLKAEGFRIALDDFRLHTVADPLLALADAVKVDFSATTPQLRREIPDRLGARAIAAIAKNIDTPTDYRRAWDEGFKLFSGFYFCQPMAGRNRRPPANQLLRIEILQSLQQHPMDLPKVAGMVKRDGPLAFQLLRLVNSPLWAVRQEIKSIQTALIAVGEEAFRRIAMTAVATEFNGDQPAELLCMAMVRARLCEVAAPALGLDPFEQYLLGLLSLLPAMQGQPMSEVAPTLPLSEPIRAALLGEPNQERTLLAWIEATERADWPAADAVASGLNAQQMASLYVESVAWAESALHSPA